MVDRDMNTVIQKNMIIVVITFDDGIDDLDEKTIASILSDELNINAEDIIITFERNDEGKIEIISVLVSDKDTADAIVSAVNDEGCQLRILCASRNARIKTEERVLESKESAYHSLPFFIIIFLILLVQTYFA